MAKAYIWKRDGETATLTLNAGSSSAFNTCYTKISLQSALATVSRSRSQYANNKTHVEALAMYKEGMALFK